MYLRVIKFTPEFLLELTLANVIKLFTEVLDKQVLVPSEPFQPSLMFVGKT
jgi:hypothetical protein